MNPLAELTEIEVKAKMYEIESTFDEIYVLCRRIKHKAKKIQRKQLKFEQKIKEINIP